MAIKDINSISPGYRDILLNQNIGKYAAITMSLIDPIGKSINIYDSTSILKKAITNGDLLGYTNKNIKNDYYNQYRNLDSIIVEYIDSKIKYTKDNSYVDKISKGIIEQAANGVLSYLMGGEVNVGVNGGNDFQITSSFDYGNTLPGLALNVSLGKESKLGEIGLRSLGLQLANSVLDKTRRNEAVLKFLEKPLDYFEAVDKLDTEKLKLTPGLSNFIGGVFPIYLYSEIKEPYGSIFNNITNTNNYVWSNISSDLINANQDDGNGIQNGSELNNQSLLYKTHQMFISGKINTLTSKLDNTGLSDYKDGLVTKGRPLLMIDKDKVHIKNSYERSWTASKQYKNIKDLIRTLNGKSSSGVDKNDILKKDLKRVRPGAKDLETYGVLQDDGFVKISPYSNFDSKTDVHRYMFSIENLAWKRKDGFLDSLIQGSSQDGPNGGRIMWFPPYDINFTDNTNVNWNTDNFIGRGEPVYTYVNTERFGSLNFKVIVDHPSILNYYKQKNSDKIGDDDYYRFFAGMDVLDLEDKSLEKDTTDNPKTPVTETSPTVYTFKVYFPNYLSGIDYNVSTVNNIIEYLYHGAYCTTDFYGGHGYEMSSGTGLTMQSGTTCCNAFFTANQKNKLDLLYDISGATIEYLQIAHDEYSVFPYYNLVETGDSLSIKKFRAPNTEDLTYDSMLDITANSVNAIDNIFLKIKIFNDKFGNYDYNTFNFDKNYFSPSIDNSAPVGPEYRGWELNIETFINALNANIGEINSEHNENTEYCNQYYLFDSTYAKSVSSLKPIENQMDITSTGLNSSEGYFDFSFKDVYEFLEYGIDVKNIKSILPTIKKIEISGSASHQGPDSVNNTLSINRANTIKNWFVSKINSFQFENLDEKNIITNSVYETGVVDTSKPTNDPEIKKERCVYIRMTDSTETSFLAPEGTQYDLSVTTVHITSLATRPKKDMYGYSANDPVNGSNSKLMNDEAKFFEKIGGVGGGNGNFIFDTFSEKIKYFHPAFHSTTPEGFNSRLTFLHQCTRQGNTENSAGLATNLAFGRPPVCVLRIGDFYNTKIIIDNLNITFEPLVWDMNPEGIGVQPMLANITMSFKFLGGSDLTGPIARLQNAITFNFFANTGVYDDRNDRIISHNMSTGDTYYPMYNPGVYDNQTISNNLPNTSDNSKPIIEPKSKNGYTYTVKQSGIYKWVVTTWVDKDGKNQTTTGKQSIELTPNQLIMQARAIAGDNIA